MAVTLSEVLTWVGQASKSEMDQVRAQMAFRQNVLARSIGRSFQPGDRVKFDGGRSRGIIHGKFIKLMQKNASVLADGGATWRVNPSLLEDDDGYVPVAVKPKYQFTPIPPKVPAYVPPAPPVAPAPVQPTSVFKQPLVPFFNEKAGEKPVTSATSVAGASAKITP
jgi:hypothetical protein